MGRATRDRRAVLLFAAVSIALTAFGIFMLRHLRVRPEIPGDAPMAEYYLSMACRCFWPGSHQPWSLHAVDAPYRYRVLVPWLASLLPLSAVTALSTLTYLSLAAFYFLILLSFRRLGISTVVAIVSLTVPYVFESHFVNYYHPFIVEGFSLAVMAAMLYAAAADAFWLFAAAGLIGIFSREMVWFVLPAWCFRDLKRGLVLAGIAGLLLVVERNLLWGAPTPLRIDPVTIASFHLHGMSNYVRDIRATWGWAFGLTGLGISLLPARAFRVMGPMTLVLTGAAVVASFLATDTPRLFGVMTPSVAIAAAALIALLAERRNYLLLISLAGLVVLQFLATAKNGITGDPAALAAIIHPIRLGTVWTLAAVYTLRRELAASLREKAALVRDGWSSLDARALWPERPRRAVIVAGIAAILIAVTTAAGYALADPERRSMNAAARAGSTGQFVRLTDGETHFEIAGPEGAPVVVLAAGMGAASYVWDPTFRALAAAGFRVLRYDYFGRGASDRPDIAYSQDVYLRQIVELLASQRIAQPIHLAGLDLGGSVITTFADRYPDRVRSLIYIAPAFRTPRVTPAYAELAFKPPYVAPGLERAPLLWDFLTAAFDERRWAEDQMADFLHPERFPDWPRQYREQTRYRGFRRALRSTLLSNDAFDQEPEIRRVGRSPRPVVVVWGRQDARVPFELNAPLREMVPQATLVEVEAGHLPHWEQSAVVEPALITFLRQ